MQALMILWRSWFVLPGAHAPAGTKHDARNNTRECRADVLAILAAKSNPKETKC